MLLLLLLYIFLVASLDIKKKKGCERIRPCQSFYCIGSSSKSAMPVKLVLQLLRCSALQKEEGEKKPHCRQQQQQQTKSKKRKAIYVVFLFLFCSFSCLYQLCPLLFKQLMVACKVFFFYLSSYCLRCTLDTKQGIQKRQQAHE